MANTITFARSPALCLLAGMLSTTPAAAAVIDDFLDPQGPQSGPGCSSSLTVTISGADRQLCPGASTASMEVASGVLDILNSGAGGGASVLTYAIPAGLAGSYIGFYLDVLQSDGSNISVVVTGGTLNSSFSIPANTISGRIEIFPLGGFTLASSDVLTITFSGSPGWDLSLGSTIQVSSSALVGVAANGDEGIGLIAAAVPEPSSVLLLAGPGLVAALMIRRRRIAR